jgi:CheY-like chemotaxis protein
MTTPSEPCVLVVEDSDEDFDTFEEAVRGTGLLNPICRVSSGGECLELLEGDTQPRLKPALILMDLNSHGLDGREALERIKTNPDLKELPVVVLTTSSNPKDMQFCYQAGANAYHVKPVRHDQNLQLIRCVLVYWLQTVTSQARRVD